MNDNTNLKEAIHRLHGCGAAWVESVPVKEIYQGQVAWNGTVEVFDLIDHPTATRAYAWSHHVKGGKMRHVAVLHVPPVDSPLAAVRAAIVAEAQAKMH